MTRSATFVLCLISCLVGASACSEPTSSVDRDLPLVNATASSGSTLAASTDSVRITLINDTRDWRIAPLNATARHGEAFWLAAFGIPGRRDVPFARVTGSIAPGAGVDVTVAAGPGSPRGKRAWVYAVAVGQPAVAGGAPTVVALKCGPKEPVAMTGAAHTLHVEFRMVATSATAVRCR